MVGEELAEYDEVAGVLNASCTTAGLKIWRNISKSAATLDFDDDDEELFDEDFEEDFEDELLDELELVAVAPSGGSKAKTTSRK
ncbi:MAG: hypothetical protein CL912_27560 [Deltaproteobacteria bacterium]|nr:hypothetical protein [Deltaproteobacteria bacterium]|tara:strand:- start:1302 stop:1553 length:252 start_codon:yes stop_codon:yes gene_type:complete